MDVLSLRCVMMGNITDLEAKINEARALVDGFLSKKYPDLKLGVSVGDSTAKVEQLQKALAELDKAAKGRTVNVKVNAEGAIEEVTALGRAMANIKDRSATVRVDVAGALSEVRVLADAVAGLKSKTINIGASGNGGAGVGGSTGGFGGAMSSLQSQGFHQMAMGSILESAVTRPIVGLAESGIDASSEFEKRMRKVTGLTNIGIENLQRYRSEVLKMAMDDPLNSKGPNELAEGLYVAASKVKDGATALAALREAAHGATAGLGDIKDIEGGVSSVLNAYNLGADKAAHLMDIFVNTVKEGGAEASQVVSAFPRVASTAAQAGLSVEEMSASIATMTRVGLSAPNSAASLNRLLLSIIKPSDQAKKAIDGLGTSFTEVLARIKGEGLQSALQDLVKRAGGDLQKLVPVLGPVNSIKAVLSTQGSQPEEYKRIVDSMRHVDGLTDKAAENATAGLSLQMERLKSAVSVAAIELGDHLAPKLSPIIKFLRDTMPDGIKTTEHAWAALDPTIKKGIAGFVGLLAMLGPVMVAMGTGKIVISALGQVWGAFGGAISGVAQGFLGLAAAGPLGLAAIVAIGAAAVIAGVSLGSLYEQTLKNKEAQDALAASTAYMVKELEHAASVSFSSSNAQKGIKQLSEHLTQAGDDVHKLLDVLKEASNTRIEIGKDMHLSPLGKAVATRDLQQFISNLRDELGELKVPISLVNRAEGRPTPETAAQELARRAAAAGVALPAPPSRTLTREASSGMGGTYQEQYPNPHYDNDVTRYNARLAQVKRDIAAAEEAKRESDARHPMYLDGAVAQTKTQTQAIREQTSAVEKLNDAEFAHERARLTRMQKEGKLSANRADGSANPNFDPQALTRAGFVEQDYSRRQKQIQDSWRVTKAGRDAAKVKADADAEVEAANAKARAESIANQARANLGQDLNERLSKWTARGNIAERLMGQFGQNSEKVEGVDELGRKLAEIKTRAELVKAGLDFSDPLSRDLVRLSGINAELQKIAGMKGDLERVFGGMYNGADAAGKAQIAALAAQFEQRLGLEKRANDLMSEGKRLSSTSLGTIEGNKDALQSQIRLNQLAGRKGFDDPKNPSDGNIATVFKGVVSSGTVLRAAQEAADAAQPAFQQTCAWAVTRMYKGMGVELQTQNNNWAANLVNYAKANWRQVDAASAPPGALLAEPSPSANSGWHVGISRGGRARAGSNNHRLQTGSAGRDALAFIPPQLDPQGVTASAPAPSSTEMPPNFLPSKGAPQFPAPSRVMTSPKAPVVSPWDEMARQVSGWAAMLKPSSDATGDRYESIVKTFKDLPKGWGQSMVQHRVQPGEQTGNRQGFEQFILEQLGKGNVIPDELAKKARSTMNWLDYQASVKSAGDGAARSLADMGQRIRLAGHDNNPYLLLLDEFEHGEQSFVSKFGKSSLLKMTLGSMRADLDAATRQSGRDTSNAVRAAGENSGMLSGRSYDASAYDRAQFQTGKRFEIWSRPDITALTEVIAKLRASGQALEAERQQKFLNERATRLLTDAMRQYDAEAAQGALKGHADEMKRLSDEAGALERVARLRGNASLSPRERENLAASAQTASDTRKELAPAFRLDTRSVASRLTDELTGGKTFTSNLLQQMGLDAGVSGRTSLADANRRKTQQNADFDANGNSSTSFNDRLAELRRQIALAGRMLPGPQLDIEQKLAQERESLLSGEFANRVGHDTKTGARVIDKATEAELQKRLKAKREELELDRDLARVQERQSNALQSQSALLDLHKQAELLTARSAAERLAIEFKYTDLLRSQAQGSTYVPPEEETKNRGEEIKQASTNERLERVRSAAGDVQRMLSDSVATGLRDGAAKGARSLLQNLKDAMMREFSNSVTAGLTNRLFRGRMGRDENGKYRDAIEQGPGMFGVFRAKHGREFPATPGIAGSNGLPFVASRYAVAPHRSNRVLDLMTNTARYATGAGTGGKDGAIPSATINVQHGEINAQRSSIDARGSTFGDGPSSSNPLGGMSQESFLSGLMDTSYTSPLNSLFGLSSMNK